MHHILKSAHRIIENSPTLKVVLPKPTHVAFRKPKTLHDKLSRSKLRPYYVEERGDFICVRRNCDICNILEPDNEFKSTTTDEVYKTNFYFYCNSECVIYLLTCKI